MNQRDRVKKRILYIMGIEWNWVFQRPHIIALMLQECYEVTVLCPRHLFKLGTQKNDLPMKMMDLIQIPFQEKSLLVRFVSDIINRHVFKDINQYDIVWIGYPIWQRYIPKDYKGYIVYDCMDNHEALYPDRRKKALDYVSSMEEMLIGRANLVFTSSNKLKEKIVDLVPVKKVKVVRNAYKDVKLHSPQLGNSKKVYALGYIGTISSWFDRDTVERSLQSNQCIYYEMVGPIDKHIVIKDNRIHYQGSKNHDELDRIVEDIDCLIMPFVLDDVVLYVDPVKLYEYIAWGKCIICSYYPEIEHFSDFVYFYQNEDEYIQLINEMCEKGFPAKYCKRQQEEFLKQNTWDSRMYTINQELMEMVCL